MQPPAHYHHPLPRNQQLHHGEGEATHVSSQWLVQTLRRLGAIVWCQALLFPRGVEIEFRLRWAICQPELAMHENERHPPLVRDQTE